MCVQVGYSNLVSGMSLRPSSWQVLIFFWIGTFELPHGWKRRQQGFGGREQQHILHPCGRRTWGCRSVTTGDELPVRSAGPTLERMIIPRSGIQVSPQIKQGGRGWFPLGRIYLPVRPCKEYTVSQGDFHLNALWQNTL